MVRCFCYRCATLQGKKKIKRRRIGLKWKREGKKIKRSGSTRPRQEKGGKTGEVEAERGRESQRVRVRGGTVSNNEARAEEGKRAAGVRVHAGLHGIKWIKCLVGDSNGSDSNDGDQLIARLQQIRLVRGNQCDRG